MQGCKDARMQGAGREGNTPSGAFHECNQNDIQSRQRNAILPFSQFLVHELQLVA